MTAFNQLLARYNAATPAERQQVLDLLPQRQAPGPSLCEWEAALRAVFDEKDEHQDTACLATLEQPPLERTSQGWNYVLPGTAPSAHQAAAARGPKIRPPAKQRDPRALLGMTASGRQQTPLASGMFAIAGKAQTPSLF